MNAVATDGQTAPQAPSATTLTETQDHSARRPRNARPRVAGKFFYLGEEKFFVRGVSYGAFEPDAGGREYHDLGQVGRDFAQMAEAGFNTVRIPHTMPPPELLDAAHRHGLKVMVGLSAEQYVGFLIDRGKGRPDWLAMTRKKVRRVTGTRRCSATGSATRSRSRSPAGSAAAGSSATSTRSSRRSRRKTPTG